MSKSDFPSKTVPAAKARPIGKVCTIVFGLLAVSIGIIAKVRPHLFMALPFPLSVILWTAAAGGEMPPYFTSAAWAEEEIKTWTKPNDVIVTTGVKSGTNWMLYCSHQIRMKGAADADELFEDVNLVTPWMDLVQSRDGSWAKQKDRYNDTVLPDGSHLKDKWDSDRFPFRVFKSHYGPKETGGVISITDNPQLKFVAMTRYGLDVVNSIVPFFNNHNENFRKMWGGFPPASSGDITIDAEQHLTDLLPGGTLAHLYFSYVKSWWPLRNEPNVLLMHYADAIKDLKGTVKKMANFYDVKLSKSELDTVVERCGFPHMKTIAHKFDYKMPFNNDAVFDNENDTIMKRGSLIYKGGLGTHKATFTEEQIQRWSKAEEEEFGADSELLQWARNGGGF